MDTLSSVVVMGTASQGYLLVDAPCNVIFSGMVFTMEVIVGETFIGVDVAECVFEA